MKMVNASALAVFLCLAACSGNSVSERDEAIAAIGAGKFEEARVHLKNALRESPNNPELHFLNGKVAVETGNFELAKTELQRLLTDPKFGKEAKALLAQAYMSSGNAQLALDTLGAEPFSSGIAYGIAADANLALGRGDQALALAKRGLQAFPQSAPLLAVDAQYAISNGDLGRARRNIRQALEHAPNDVRVILLAGRMSLIDGDKVQAEQQFDRVLELDNDNPVALLAKAAIAHERGDDSKAKAFLEKAAQVRGNTSLLTLAFMAQMAIEAGNFDHANQIIGNVPAAASMPYLDMLRGVIAAGRGQNELAVSLLQQYFRNGGEGPAARIALASALSKTGQPAPAWQVLKPLANAANADAPVLQLAVQLTSGLNLPEAGLYRARLAAASQPDPTLQDMRAANAAITRGDWARADRIYQQLLAQNPASTSIILYNNAALARLNLGDNAKAIELARRANALAPDDPIVNDTLGWVLFKAQGATPEAIALIRKAYAAQPGNAEIQSHLAQIREAERSQSN